MANTFVALATVTVGAGQLTTVEFSNIPSTYTDLKIVMSARVVRTTDARSGSRLWFNNTTSLWGSFRVAGYDANSVIADAGGSSYYDQPQPTAGQATANTFANIEYYIPQYAGSQSEKTIYSLGTTENNSTSSWIMDFGNGRWTSSNAITNIKIDGNGHNFGQYSTFTLYGIKNS